MALTEISSKSIKDGEIVNADIADDTIAEAKLDVSNAPADGKFLQYKDSSDKLTWATVSTDLVADTSPQLGGDLDTNDHEILLDDNHAIKFGAGNDVTIKSDGTVGQIDVLQELDFNVASQSDALKLTSTGVITNTDQFVAYSDVVVGSITSGQRHWIGLAEDAANGTHTVRFQAPASLANTLTYTLNLAGGSTGQYLKLNGANIEWADAGAGATGGGTEKIFWENGTTIDQDYTVGASFGAACNAMSAGPITINTGKTVTVDAGDTWTIV